MQIKFRFSAQTTQRGFTLLELIVVLVILSAISTFVFTNWTHDDNEFDVQIERLRRDLRLTQSLAMAQGKRYRINFNVNHYSITDLSGAPINHPAISSSTVPFPSIMTLSWNTLLLPENALIFDTQGRPFVNTSGDTALSAPVVVMLINSGATKSRNLTINPETGFVSSRFAG
jgi:prepilin-type N-terminal cleavage/methylation domain-containing protein